MSGTVLFLGAGATKSVKGPLTDEILPTFYAEQAQLAASDPTGPVARLVHFLETEFHMQPGLSKELCPGLPLLMSLLDLALDRREAFNREWDVDVIGKLRKAIELGIFDVLEQALNKFPTTNHFGLLQKVFPFPAIPQIISTNYDLVADTALIYVGQGVQAPGGLPDYHCELANVSAVGPVQTFGTLLKLHGSVNWLYCQSCKRLELGATDSTRFLSIFGKVVGHDLRSSLTADGTPCSVCGQKLLPLLVAPSHLKDYRNPHLSRVWFEAQRLLRQADRVIFVGYSMPDDDVEVVYLVKRGLAHIQNPKQITVVEYCENNPSIALPDHPVGRRYRTLFGDVDWCAAGLDNWLARGSV